MTGAPDGESSTAERSCPTPARGALARRNGASSSVSARRAGDRGGAGQAPDRVADVVGQHEVAPAFDRDADGPAHRVAFGVDEAGQHVERIARGLAALEWNEDDLVAAARPAGPRAAVSPA